MKKIAILGKSTMSGHVIYDYLSKINDFELIGFEENEIIKNDLLINCPALEGYDYIINCLRCLVEDSEHNPQKSIIYNSLLPLYFNKKFINTTIVHLSTDCVFSGKDGNYNENSIHDGESNYALTKSMGELSFGNNINIRTSYIGPTLKNNKEELFDWFLTQKKDVYGYDNSYWNGITTLELAKSIESFVRNNFIGTYHLIGNEKISKYELLLKIKDIWSKDDIKLIKKNNLKIDRTLIDNNKLIKRKSYNIMLKELFEYMMINKSKYKKYL